MTEKRFESLDDDFCLVDGKIFVKFARIFKLIEDADSLESLEAISDALEGYMNMLQAKMMTFNEFVIIENVLIKINDGIKESKNEQL